MFVAPFMPEVFLGSQYLSCVNHVDVKTSDKRLARIVLAPSREKSTPSMIKHLELRSSENYLTGSRAFKTQMIALELVFVAKDCFHDLSFLIFDFYWNCSIVAVYMIIHFSSLFPSLTYTLVLILRRQYVYLSVHC